MHSHLHAVPILDGGQLAGFITIYSYSFFASFHCAFMCAPMVAAVLGPRAHVKHYELWTYNLTRIFAYTALGFALGYLSETINYLITGSATAIAWAIGSIMTVLGILRLLGLSIPMRFEKLTRLLIHNPLLRNKSLIRQSVGLGAITVLLPCMTLMPALMLAAGSGQGSSGAITMMGFGLGTLPVMMITPASVGALVATIPRKLANIVANLCLILGGLITIYRVYM